MSAASAGLSCTQFMTLKVYGTLQMPSGLIWFNPNVSNVFPANSFQNLLKYSCNPTKFNQFLGWVGNIRMGYWEKQLFCIKQIKYIFYSCFACRIVLFYLRYPKQAKNIKLRIFFSILCEIFISFLRCFCNKQGRLYYKTKKVVEEVVR